MNITWIIGLEAVLVIFGWLLGLLSAPIAARIQKIYRRNDLKTAIFSELKYLAVKLAATCQLIQMDLGIGDKATLLWAKDIQKKYRVDLPKNVLEAMDKVQQVPDEQFKAVIDSLKAPDNMGLMLKPFETPFIESILADLSVFDPKFQNRIFEIRDRIDMLNGEIEIGDFYFRLTFDPAAMEANKTIIRANIQSTYNNVQNVCKTIADRIEKVLTPPASNPPSCTPKP